MDEPARKSRLWIIVAALCALILAGAATWSCAVQKPEGTGLDPSEAVPVPDAPD